MISPLTGEFAVLNISFFIARLCLTEFILMDSAKITGM